VVGPGTALGSGDAVCSDLGLAHAMQAGQEIAVVTVRLHYCWSVGEEYAPLSERESGALMTMETGDR
jgi:hypothetical protein